jgi:hypothetical protein
MKRLLCSCLLCLAWVSWGEAVCGGSGLSRTAASASRTDVSDCVTAAATGATITVPAGTQSWASGITVAKSLTIIGNGIGSTNITCTSGCFAISNGYTTRISGFTFYVGTGAGINHYGAPTAGATSRIDHNRFEATSRSDNNIIGDAAVSCNEVTPLHPSVLYDNNQFQDRRVVVVGTLCNWNDGSAQHRLWAQTPPRGSWPGIVYLEDNTFTATSGGAMQGWIDGNYGARYVGRFNTLSGASGSGPYIEVHSVQENNRAVQWWEFYGNSQNLTAANYFGLGFLRGGSGIFFGNTLTGSVSTHGLLFDNVRSNATGVPGDGGTCNGTSTWDQNTSGQGGWACRDQIGRSQDAVLWAPGGVYNQPAYPLYMWNNLAWGSQLSPSFNTVSSFTDRPDGPQTAAHIVANRDFYNHSAATGSPQTVGTRVGTKANMPAGCTAGVGYWVTDEGFWNSKTPGVASGVLYKCTGNAWVVGYVPYPYPHPLQSGLAAPTGLTVK